MSLSASFFEQAKHYIPGGVNSPVRAFQGVGGTPIFFQSAKGAYLTDVDNRKYIDYVGAWGPMILGHNYPAVVDAVQKALSQGMCFGAPTPAENELAELIISLMPCIEKIRMVNSGTEATMSAIRLARGYTKRDKIVKFEGCYHGHSDGLLVKAGSGALTLSHPSSQGVPTAIAEQTLVATYNDLNSVQKLFEAKGSEIAAIIVEPVAGNMNCVPPVAGFLDGLRSLCDDYHSVLIFDEVMTGFRVALGGASSLYGVQPDLVTLGKIIGGGLPVGAFGGRADIMKLLAPLGPVYQAGTLSGNPLAMAAGIATLKAISVAGFHEKLTTHAQYLMAQLAESAKAACIPLSTHVVGGMFGFYFSDEAVITRYQQVARADIETFKRFYHAMLQQGVYFAPSAFEAGFISSAHTQEDLDTTLEAAKKAFATL